MDGAKHSSLRKLVSSVFTPRQVAKIQEQIQSGDPDRRRAAADQGGRLRRAGLQAPTHVDHLRDDGLPPGLRDEAAHNADGMVSWADEDVAAGRESGQVLTDSLVGLLTAGLELAEERRSHPTSDLMSLLVQAEVDGRELTDEEIGAFFVLLSVAGNDTTRNTITLSTMALQEFPHQRALLEQDFDGVIRPAMEEFVRWASPVMTFRRTATQDTVLRDQEIKEGEWVLLMYSSGNRDERVFTDPNTFDIRRKPNNHVGFGGGGPHFCMGSFPGQDAARSLLP